MPSKYKHKKGLNMQYSTDQLTEAVNQVSNEVLSVRQTSGQFGIHNSG